MADGSRVLHVVSGIDVGGAENHLLDLCSGLTDAGFEVTVAYLKGDGELRPEFEAAGCEVIRVGISRDIDPAGFARLVQHLRRHHYDIVHTHLYHGDVYGAFAAALTGVPAVLSSKHNDSPFWAEQPHESIHNATLRVTDRVMPISEHVAEHLERTSTVDPSKVRVVRYGLDPSPFDEVGDETVAAVRSEFGAPDEFLVGTVARLTEQKDLPTLVRAFAALGRLEQAHLVIVGRGEEESSLRRLVDRLGTDDRVTFAGFRRDIPPLMKAFDVFALPSKWEGFGVVFLEAMAARTPVAASAVSAIPEVVSDGETGLLCPPGDVSAFSGAIDELLGNAGRRSRMGRAGRERLEETFTLDGMRAEMMSVYHDVLN